MWEGCEIKERDKINELPAVLFDCGLNPIL